MKLLSSCHGDPYTELGYFETITKMVECVKQNVAELVLMGITPTYPSKKYGYVVPEKVSTVISEHIEAQKVQRFIEKPSVEKAKDLLAENAYWNGGVFAFHLGYMMDIVYKYIPLNSFDEACNRYFEFPKISFDYEVAMKAESVVVVPFAGKWKDLGTWNTLTEELHKPIIGNVVMGSHCENTHVINSLLYPIYVDGLKDVVVVTSLDGILICGKKYSEEIKIEVERLTSHLGHEERKWGTYRVLDDCMYKDGQHILTKSITLNPGKNISYHVHHHRSEVWTFVQGEGIYVLDGKVQKVKVGDTIVIPVEHFHALKAITTLTLVEIQCGDPLEEEDIERIEWKWSE